MSPSSAVIKSAKPSKSPKDPHQRTFNRLRDKIASLQKLEEVRLKELDNALNYYQKEILPQQQAYSKAFAERAILTYQIYTQKKHWFSRKEQKEVKELILHDIDALHNQTPADEIPPEIHEIFANLGGNRKQLEEAKREDFEAMKSDLEEEFKTYGLNLNLSGIDLNDSEEEMMEKLFQSAGSAMGEHFASIDQAPKTKQQIEKASKRQKIEELQKRSLNTIYKQLAKAFHPDLEPDTYRKGKKEEFMKKLTVAYEEKDLFTLLAIEQEWVRSYEGTSNLTKDLKTYNELLKEQAEALQARIDMLILRPPYFPLQSFYPESFTGISKLHRILLELKEDLSDIQYLNQQLRTPFAKDIIKNAIQEVRILRSAVSRFG
jgi:hypothetical protein